MTHQEFINTWNNKYLERVDPTNPFQCFDLVVAYCDDVLKIPRVFPFQYAYEIYTKFGPLQAQYFDRIYNDPNAIAKPQDIIVWSGQYNNGAGHTAVDNKADLYNLECFTQNDPKGSKCILRSYNYKNILGFLRPKSASAPPMNDTQKVNEITKIMQSGKTFEQEDREVRKVLGL